MRFEPSAGFTVNPTKLEAESRPNSAGIPYTLLLRIESIGFPIFGLLLQSVWISGSGFGGCAVLSS